MDPKFQLIFTVTLLTLGSTFCQNVDDLPMPEEKDNQFPADFPAETIEGSGNGAIENAADNLDTTTPQILDDIEEPNPLSNVSPFSGELLLCPADCTCSQEGEGETYSLIVDCSSKELTELPAPIDGRTTTLNLQNNKLTEIPKSISELKNLKVLNVNDNSIMNLAFGSISELQQLTSLKLANNRLLEIPQDLKNSFGLTKLEELDLGGNDIRDDVLQTDIFANFTSLRILTLPTLTGVHVEQICKALSNLQTICSGSCKDKPLDCPDFLEKLSDGDIPVSPGQIPASLNEESDPTVSTVTDNAVTVDVAAVGNDLNVDTNTEYSLRNAVDKETTTSGPAVMRAVLMRSNVDHIEPTKESTKDTKQDLKVDTESSDSLNGGGVDKGVIGIIIAVMIVLVAVLVIKKNWSSIRNRFRSNPRTGSDRPEAHANGSAPEEVPLQEKSPV